MSNEEGKCRFNCRTQRQAFEAGWMAATEYEFCAEPPDDDEEEWLERSYRDWKRRARA